MDIDSLTIGEAKQLASVFGGGPAKTQDRDHGWCIVILDRGHVLVGNCRVTGDWVETTEASIVRVWGTTRGLGQLAKDGPTSKTALDPIGTVRSPLRALIGIVPCEGSGKWNK